MGTSLIRETATTSRPVNTNTGRWRARIIEGDRWGSSGYYSREVLERDGATAWPAGTPVFMDHPGEQEMFDRPERSIRDLAGKITTDPIYEADGLYADVEFYPHVAPIVEAMAADIGLSIRASAEVETGEAQGRTGQIITRISEGMSVDLVTKAGAGGKLVSVLESARREYAKQVREATADERREQLSRLVKDTYGGESTWVYVLDYDDDRAVVWFTVENGDDTGTYEQAYTVDGDVAAALTGDRTEVRRVTTYVPVNPAGQSTPTQESEEDTMPEIQESELARLREADRRVTTLESEVTEAVQRAEKAETALAEARKVANQATAERVVREAFDTAGVTAPKTAARLAASAPLTEAGDVDTEALKQAAEESAAELAEASGAGRVRGLGAGTNATEDGDLTEADFDAELARISGRTIKEA